MSGYSSAQEDANDSAKPGLLMEQDMLIVSDDVHSAPRSGRESLDVSDDDAANITTGRKVNEEETLELKRIAFHKPSLSLTLMTEDEDGNVSLRTEEYEEDKHVTMIMDNEGSESRTEEEAPAKEDDCVQEDLGEALKDMKVMSSLMKSRKSTASSRSVGMKRWKGTIVNESDSDDEDIVAKLSLMLVKSDETPVLTVPLKLDDGCLTDTENFED